MSSLTVLSPMGLRRAAFGARLAPACAALLLAACAAGDAVDPSGTGSGSSSGGGGPGQGGASASSAGGQAPTGGTPTSSTGPGSGPATTTTGGAGGSPTSGPTSSGPGGGDGPTSGPGGGEGGSGVGPGGGGDGPGGGGGSGQGGADPVCGDGVLNGIEDCEGGDLGGESCTTIDQGFVGGDLACTDDCTLDTAGCTAPPDCGNGIIEGDEECDGAQLGGADCGSRGFTTGDLACTGGCVFDESDCETCGDGIISGSELCDGSDLGGQDCEGLGHDGGTLTCAGTCMSYVEGACSDCGDGQIEGDEECDGTNFGGQTCASLGFTAGTLLCTGSCGTINTASCYECGDGQIDGVEQCDGGNLDGETCLTLGYELGGTLTCQGNCLNYNTSACVDSLCNDGFDNDGDGFTDLQDVGCTSAADASEIVYATSCNGVNLQIVDITDADTETPYGYLFDSSSGTQSFSSSGCGGSGRERIFVYRSPIAQDWIQFTTDFEETSFDTVIYARRGSCTGSQAACNDDDPFWYWYDDVSRIQVDDVQQGELIFIFVDAWFSGQGGEFGVGVLPASAYD